MLSPWIDGDSVLFGGSGDAYRVSNPGQLKGDPLYIYINVSIHTWIPGSEQAVEMHGRGTYTYSIGAYSKQRTLN